MCKTHGMAWQPPTDGNTNDLPGADPGSSQAPEPGPPDLGLPDAAPPAPAPPAPAPPVQWEVQTPAPVAEVAPGLAYAGAAARIVAYIIDAILVWIATLLVIAVLVTIFPARNDAISIASTVVFVSLLLVYFVGFWTSSYRGTPGMRMLKLQIGSATDGRTLTPGQAVRRWVAIGFPLALLGVVPTLAGGASAIFAIWLIILTISVASSPTKQGIHDRFAGSAIVQPTTASNAGAMACLIIAGLLLLIPILAIVALIFLGGQVATLLSDMGNSI